MTTVNDSGKISPTRTRGGIRTTSLVQNGQCIVLLLPLSTAKQAAFVNGVPTYLEKIVQTVNDHG